MRLDHGLARQAEQLGRLSQEKLRQKLDGEARLAGARVEMLFARFQRSVENIAQRADIGNAVASANVVEISALLNRAGRLSDIDGIVVVDEKMRVVGASGDDLDIVSTNRALHQHQISKEIEELLARNDRKKQLVLQRTVKLDADLMHAIRAKSTAPLAFLVVQPLFDDFGDVSAALIAHRVLRPVEPVLEEFSRLDGAGLMLLAESRPISSAGITNSNTTIESVPDTALLRTDDGTHWARCITLFQEWAACALASVSELHELRDELVRIGEREGRSLARWLVMATLVFLAVFALVTLFASRRVANPLTQITNAVRAVARGDWKSEVSGADRKDEVGDIARAVIVLQRTLQERDRLRSDVAQAETIKKRREMLEDAIKRFDRLMRSMLLSVSDTVESMDETARDLARMSVVAEGEAAEAAFVSEHTVSNVSDLRGAAERLNLSISETVQQIKQTMDILDRSSALATDASARAETLSETATHLDEVSATIKQVAATANSLALGATMQLARGDDPEKFAALVSDMRNFADFISAANQDAGDRLAALRHATGDTAGSTREVAQKLQLVLQQTKMISFAIQQQEATAREVASNMLAATNGTVDLSSSVDRLRGTIEEARGASTKVIEKAANMADEAHRLDSTVKSFLREVTA